MVRVARLAGLVVGLLLVPVAAPASWSQLAALTAEAQGSDLLAHWGFDDGAGTLAADLSGNGQTGTLQGGPLWVPGRAGLALELDGQNDLVRVPSSAALNAAHLTVMAWIRPAAGSAENTVISRNAFSNVDGWGFWYSHSLTPAGAMMVHYSRPGINVILEGTTALAPEVWTHVAFTYDGGMFRLYVNGVLDGTEPWTEGIGRSFDDAVRIGTTNGGAGDGSPFFRGRIDDTRMYGRALSQAEVAAIANPCAPGVTLDTDGDALLDCWEIDGIDGDGDGRFDLSIAVLGANYLHKDLFVEVDYMDCALGGCDVLGHPFGGSHRPTALALQMVEQAFAQAPVQNPDGRPGIRLHVLLDEPMPEVTPLRFSRDREPEADPAGTFDALKCGQDDCSAAPPPCQGHFGTPLQRADPNCANVLAAKARAYRYAIFGHGMADVPGAAGIGEVASPGIVEHHGGNDLLVSLGEWTGNTALRSLTDGQAGMEAGNLFHELGHTLGLLHGGHDDTNCKPNYLSVMSYTLLSRALDPTRPLDFSRQSLHTLDEDHLDETLGIVGPPGRTAIHGKHQVPIFVPFVGITLVDGVPFPSQAQGPINWDHDPALSTDLAYDVNHVIGLCPASPGQTLVSHEDWLSLDYGFEDPGDCEVAGVNCSGSPSFDMTAAGLLEAAARVDFDGDGLSNLDDPCPADAEPVNGVADEDGCPEVTLTTHTAAPSEPPAGVWTRGSWAVELACAGCRTEYEVDGTPYAYEAPFAIEREGLHTLRFQSALPSGSREPWQAATFGVDRTAPLTQVEGTATGPVADEWTSGDWLVEFPCEDPLAGSPAGASGCATTLARADDAPLAPAEPVTFTAEGRHEVGFTSADLVGNVESLGSRPFAIDRTPPEPAMLPGDLVAGDTTVFVPPAAPVVLRALVPPDLAGGEPGAGIASVCFRLTAPAPYPWLPEACIPATAVGGDAWQAEPALGPGLYHVHAVAADRVANAAESAPLTVLVAGPPPLPATSA